MAYLVAAAARAIRELAGLAESEIRFAFAETRAAFAEELANTVAGLAAKYHDEHCEGGRRFRLLAACYPVLKHDVQETESVNL